MTRSLFKDYGNRQRQRPQDEVTQMMKEVTQTYMEEMERDSMFFATNPRRRIATFDPSGKDFYFICCVFDLIVCVRALAYYSVLI